MGFCGQSPGFYTSDSTGSGLTLKDRQRLGYKAQKAAGLRLFLGVILPYLST